jgi:FMN-dependent NADH-azoreductase
MTRTVLHIDSSARTTGSATRDLSAKIVTQLNADTVISRDLAADALPQIDETWVAANFTAADQRSAEQIARLGLSDTLVAELQAADTIVIGVPVYNFSVPTSVKAWIDLIARAGLTFKYGENGPQGLLTGKRVILAVASGGTPIGSDMDFATPYLRHVLGFVGMSQVEIVAADQTAISPDATLTGANQAVRSIAA